MGSLRYRRLALAIFLLLSSSATSLPLLSDSYPGGGAVGQQQLDNDRTEVVGGRDSSDDQIRRYRILRGLGSSPPTCRSKCGRCYPCRPVQVPVESYLSLPLEYYPEAWRCKCHDRLFMP
ncbi:hypothetical protein SAY86_025008 [Trapa natans]|uniref:Epidermal patterning factor-like protein n=1 Tax=Trapa natans TaxID=22666 RepID=A0AAN7MW77_TRANT|nr:hypothetical protein SAY86_025008 [Trapa natans]